MNIRVCTLLSYLYNDTVLATVTLLTFLFSIIHSVLAPKFCVNYCCEAFLRGLHIPKNISKPTIVYAKFQWGGGKEVGKQNELWASGKYWMQRENSFRLSKTTHSLGWLFITVSLCGLKLLIFSNIWRVKRRNGLLWGRHKTDSAAERLHKINPRGGQPPNKSSYKRCKKTVAQPCGSIFACWRSE